MVADNEFTRSPPRPLSPDDRNLRDQFAMAALGPIMAYHIKDFGYPCFTVYRRALKAAYAAADAALDHRP